MPKTKESKSSSLTRSSRRSRFWLWIRKSLPLAGLASLLSVAATWATIYYDRPSLQVTISAGTPEFRNNRETWSMDQYKKVLDGLVDAGLAYASVDYLHKNRLLVPDGKELAKNRMQALAKEFGSIKVRIPLYIRVSNNGRRATTIVAGQFIAHDWGKVFWDGQIRDIKERIGPSEVHDFKVRYIEFDGMRHLPESLSMDIIFELYLRKMSSLVPDLKLITPKDFQQGFNMMNSMLQPLMKEISGDESLDVREGFKIEVRLTDQFDEIVASKTDVIRLKSSVKLQQ